MWLCKSGHIQRTFVTMENSSFFLFGSLGDKRTPRTSFYSASTLVISNKFMYLNLYNCLTPGKCLQLQTLGDNVPFRLIDPTFFPKHPDPMLNLCTQASMAPHFFFFLFYWLKMGTFGDQEWILFLNKIQRLIKVHSCISLEVYLIWLETYSFQSLWLQQEGRAHSLYLNDKSVRCQYLNVQILLPSFPHLTDFPCSIYVIVQTHLCCYYFDGAVIKSQGEEEGFWAKRFVSWFTYK